MIKILVLVIGLMSSNYSLAEPTEVKVVSGTYYPCLYQTASGDIDGYAYRLANKLIDELNLQPSKIAISDWLRSYLAMSEKRAVMHICLAYTQQRSPKFQWAGPIWTDRFSLFSLAEGKAFKHPISQLTMGCVQGFAMCEQAQQLGYKSKQLMRFRSEKALYQAFAKQKIDLLLAPEKSAAKKLAYFTGEQISIKRIISTEFSANFYFTFNQQTPRAVVAKVQSTLDKWQQQGYIDRLKTHWQDDDSTSVRLEKSVGTSG